jgi:hypothetical protein
LERKKKTPEKSIKTRGGKNSRKKTKKKKRKDHDGT